MKFKTNKKANILTTLGLQTVNEFSYFLNCSRGHASEILNGKRPITELNYIKMIKVSRKIKKYIN